MAGGPHKGLDVLRVLMTFSLESRHESTAVIAMAATASLLLKWPNGVASYLQAKATELDIDIYPFPVVSACSAQVYLYHL